MAGATVRWDSENQQPGLGDCRGLQHHRMAGVAIDNRHASGMAFLDPSMIQFHDHKPQVQALQHPGDILSHASPAGNHHMRVQAGAR